MAKRNNEQNALAHCYFRQIAEFLHDGGLRISEAMVKELVKVQLGNMVEVLGVKVAMPTSSYKMAEHELTQYDHQHGYISFDQLIDRMVAWSATDLSLILVSPNEKDMVNNG